MLSRLWLPDPEPRSRGGFRQRALAAQVETQDAKISLLASRLLLSWASGTTSAVQLVDTMRDAVADGLKHIMVVRIANVPRDQHSHEGVMGIIRRRTAVFDDIRVIDGAVNDAPCHILLPSVIFRTLHQHYPQEFIRRLGADSDRLAEFWRCFSSGPNKQWVRRHPILQTLSREQLALTIPLCIHEDAGPITKKSSANCISIAGLLGSGNEKLTHWLCSTYIKKKKGEIDNTAMWNALIADLEALSSGEIGGSIVAPVGGTDSLQKWRFVCLFAKADEQVRCDEWKLIHYNGAPFCCSECFANRSTIPWTDMRRGARWRQSESMDAEIYKGRCHAPLHPLISSKLFWRLFCVLDIMHILDCKGMSSTIYGSALGMLLHEEVRLGTSQVARMQQINFKMQLWYSTRPGTYRLPNLSIASLTSARGWYELGGPAIKAANTKAAAGFIHSLAVDYMDDGSETSTAVRKLTSSLVSMYSVLDRAGMFLSNTELEQFREHVHEWGISLQFLRAWAEGAGSLYFQVRPKAHKVLHLPMVAATINPNYVSNYACESQIGTTTLVWKGSVSGRYKRSVQKTVLAKRWLAVLLRYERGE